MRSTSSGRRRLLVFPAAVLAATLVAGCAAFAPNSVHLSREQISEAIAKRFPYSARWLGVFELTASAPRLMLMPETNRVGAEVDVVIHDTLFSRDYRGGLLMNSGLRFQPADRTVRLVGVRVDRFAVDGLPIALQAQAVRLGAGVAEQLLEGTVMHTLSESAARRLAQGGVTPGEIQVNADGLTISLNPAPR